MSEYAKESINQQFGGKVRVRIGGILIENDKVLLLKHEGVGPDQYLWSPPGGGMEFGQDAEQTLVREFKEETNLTVKVENFLFVNEFMEDRIHAIELFFKVTKVGGDINLGIDPEMNENQILTEFKFFDYQDLKKVQKNRLHNIFHAINKPQEVFNLTGYFKFVINSLK
jgi:8-oxo-dGTP diphosphatase